MSSGKSSQIALGGVFSSLCLLFMFMSSMIPFSSFAAPMLAGASLAVVVIENGEKTAWLAFIAVSLLSVFVVSDMDAKLLFISFFGYYPILKPRIDRIRGKLPRLFFKLLILNAAMISAYLASLYFFGMDEAASQNDFLGRYMPLLTLVGMNVTFLLYDNLLDKYVMLYLTWFKPTFLRR